MMQFPSAARPGPGPGLKLLVACLALVGAATLCAQNNAADTETLIDVLQLKPGAVVAEIGAGSGDLTLTIARHVGPTGRVYSSELGADALGRLKKAVSGSGAGNVEVVEGQALHANLPDACCDAVFMRNVYHHFGDPAAMNASLVRALKPGARVAVIDFSPRNNAATAPAGERGGSAHGVSPDTVVAELKAAGLEIVSSQERSARWFLVVAAKPSAH